MSDSIISRLSGRIAEFKRMLDASDNVQPTERKSFDIITRESVFPSSLRQVVQTDQPQTRRPQYYFVFKDYPTSGELSYFDSDPNGTYTLTNTSSAVLPSGAILYDYTKRATFTGQSNDGPFQFDLIFVAQIEVPTAASELKTPWNLSVSVLPTGSLYQKGEAAIGVFYPPELGQGSAMLGLNWLIS